MRISEVKIIFILDDQRKVLKIDLKSLDLKFSNCDNVQ